MLNAEKTAALNKPGRVILEDEWGEYETDEKRLDDHAGDPNRHGTWWDRRAKKRQESGEKDEE